MQITSSSHCSNIPKAYLPFGVLTIDSTDEQKKATANALAVHVNATMIAFPAEYPNWTYRKGLCEQAASCAVADDDYEDMQEEIVRLTYFASCAL